MAALGAWLLWKRLPDGQFSAAANAATLTASVAVCPAAAAASPAALPAASPISLAVPSAAFTDSAAFVAASSGDAPDASVPRRSSKTLPHTDAL